MIRGIRALSAIWTLFSFPISHQQNKNRIKATPKRAVFELLSIEKERNDIFSIGYWFARLSIEIIETARFQNNYFWNYDTFVRHKNCAPYFCNLRSFPSRFQHYRIRAFFFGFSARGYCQPATPSPKFQGDRAPRYVVHPKTTVEMCCRRNRGGMNVSVPTLINQGSYPLVQ